mgnify:CR=1 FL=1
MPAKVKLPDVTLVAVDGAGCNKNILKSLNVSKRDIDFGDILFISSNKEDISAVDSDTRFQEIEKITYEGWNKFVLKEIGDFIETSHYLYVDYDGFVIHPQAWTDEFLEYDYIGAPFWYPAHIHTQYVDQAVKDKPKDDLNLVGNGGFTLRSKKFFNVAKGCPDTRYVPEDVYSCLNNYDYYVERGVKYAPHDLASRFSSNQLHSNPSVLGFHGHKTHINNF